MQWLSYEIICSNIQNAKQFYIIKDYKDKSRKRTTKIAEKLGNEQEILKKSNGIDATTWAKNYIKNLNKL